MILAKSSNIESFDWDGTATANSDETTQGVLKVKFKSGVIYEYLDVPIKFFYDLQEENTKEGGSVGKYLGQHIKSTFQYRKAVTREALENELKAIKSGQTANLGVDLVVNRLKDVFGLVV
jgi:hypothetical protein